MKLSVCSLFSTVKERKKNSKGCVPLGGSGFGFVIRDYTDHVARKEQSFRRALKGFQKVRYFKTCVYTWVTELFPEWLV